MDEIKITDKAKEELQSLSKRKIIFPENDATDIHQAIERIGDAEVVLGNWQSKITADLLDQLPQVKYIGICGSNLATVDQEAVKKNGIVLKNVTDYGDEGVAEYLFVQLLNLIRGFGIHQWKDEACELHSKTIGIVGLGATGQQVARVALGFKMNVLYNSQSRKQEWEEKGVIYSPLPDLCNKSDIISFHVPKNLKIIDQNVLDSIGNGKILTDTCLGVIYQDFEAVRKWLSSGGNYLIRDHQPEIEQELSGMDRFIYTSGVIAGITTEARERLSEKVLINIRQFLKSSQPYE